MPQFTRDVIFLNPFEFAAFVHARIEKVAKMEGAPVLNIHQPAKVPSNFSEASSELKKVLTKGNPLMMVFPYNPYGPVFLDWRKKHEGCPVDMLASFIDLLPNTQAYVILMPFQVNVVPPEELKAKIEIHPNISNLLACPSKFLLGIDKEIRPEKLDEYLLLLASATHRSPNHILSREELQ